jgi:UDP-N-acetylmuramate dehydrogenase
MSAAYRVRLPLRAVVSSDIGGVAVEESVPVAPLTTLRIGPVARRLVTCDTTAKLVAVLRELPADAPPDRVLILAGGSNVVLADDLTDLVVVRVANAGITVDGALLRAEAGAGWDDVVRASLAHGLSGLECLSGIPGSAGATPVQNVGAYGVEVADVISRVRLFDRRTGEDHWVEPDALKFGYRTSVLKNSSHAVVLEVEFALRADGLSAPLRYGELASALGLEPGSRADPTRVRAEVLKLRGRKGMVLASESEAGPDHDTWSVGSFFTNPVVSPAEFARLSAAIDGPMPNYPAPDGVKLAAGWLVERAGFGRGFPDAKAPARLSTKHALALTNRGTATTADLLALARTVRDGVRGTFGIDLTPEPCLIGCAL